MSPKKSFAKNLSKIACQVAKQLIYLIPNKMQTDKQFGSSAYN
jgi:hypothetical protein